VSEVGSAIDVRWQPITGRAAARPLSRKPTGAGQFRTCLASLMVTDIGDDARWNVSAADVGTVLGIAHRAGFIGRAGTT
jgi:hypothetical protein